MKGGTTTTYFRAKYLTFLHIVSQQRKITIIIIINKKEISVPDLQIREESELVNTLILLLCKEKKSLHGPYASSVWVFIFFKKKPSVWLETSSQIIVKYKSFHKIFRLNGGLVTGSFLVTDNNNKAF